MTRNACRITVIGAAVAAVLSGAALADPVGRTSLLGSPASTEDHADKIVAIDGNTRWVNVTQDETVKFVVSGGKSFVWRFDTPEFAVNLKDIAPSGTVDRSIYVYVAPDPLYDSSD